MSGVTAASSNSRQCGQVSEPYSTSFTFASGLPIRKPPCEVGLTTWLQSPPCGGFTVSSFTGALVAASPCLELQPAMATTAIAQTRNLVGVMDSLGSLDHWYLRLRRFRQRRRTAGSGNLRRKRLQAGAQLGIGDLAQTLAQLLRNGAKLGALRPCGRGGRLALPENDSVDCGIAEETVHPLDDHRREVLDQRRVRAVDQPGQDSARLSAGRN